jgi:hypothetical protein
MHSLIKKLLLAGAILLLTACAYSVSPYGGEYAVSASSYYGRTPNYSHSYNYYPYNRGFNYYPYNRGFYHHHHHNGYPSFHGGHHDSINRHYQPHYRPWGRFGEGRHWGGGSGHYPHHRGGHGPHWR